MDDNAFSCLPKIIIPFSVRFQVLVVALAVAVAYAYPEGGLYSSELEGHDFGGHEGLQAVDYSAFSHGGGSSGYGHSGGDQGGHHEEHIDYYVSIEEVLSVVKPSFKKII